jgi:HD-GYP domain-containing protein (c-di-GMP phosphodiesterase class II)
MDNNIFNDVLNGLKDIIKQIYKYDQSTFEHSIRVGQLAYFFGNTLNLDEYNLKNLVTASILHDYGKIKVPKEIINNNKKLNFDERN